MIKRSEWRWVLTRSLLVIIVALVPYVFAAMNTPEGHVFSGLLVNARDGNSYLAKMRQGYDGEWLFRLPFTPEDQNGILVYTFYLFLGHLAQATGFSLIGLYHAARILAGLMLLLTLYRLAAELTADVTTRRWAFRLGAFASGLGYYALLVGHHTSVDLWMPETNTFFSILTNPHFPLSFALSAWAVLLVLGQEKSQISIAGKYRKWKRWICILIVAVALALIAPYLAPAVWIAVVGGLLLSHPRLRANSDPQWVRAAIGRAALLVSAMAVFLIYDLLVSHSDPTISAWSAQAVMPSPEILDYFLGFGILLPLALVGAVGVWRDGRPVGRALLCWIAGVSLLVYAPHQMQRGFAAGVHLPIAILAAFGLVTLLTYLSRLNSAVQEHRVLTIRNMQRGLLCGVILLAIPTNLVLVIWLSTAPDQPGTSTYLSQGEWTALKWLNERTTSKSVVLAPPELSNLIPGYTGARVVYGHPMETIDAVHKESVVEDYYQGRLAGARAMAMFEQYNVVYIVIGPQDKMDGVWIPESAALAYDAGGVMIFSLVRNTVNARGSP